MIALAYLAMVSCGLPNRPYHVCDARAYTARALLLKRMEII